MAMAQSTAGMNDCKARIAEVACYRIADSDLSDFGRMGRLVATTARGSFGHCSTYHGYLVLLDIRPPWSIAEHTVEISAMGKHLMVADASAPGNIDLACTATHVWKRGLLHRVSLRPTGDILFHDLATAEVSVARMTAPTGGQRKAPAMSRAAM